MLMKKISMSMADALDTLYNSETYEKLSDPRSGLYYQAPGYVYDFLDKEIEYGKMQQLIPGDVFIVKRYLLARNRVSFTS